MMNLDKAIENLLKEPNSQKSYRLYEKMVFSGNVQALLQLQKNNIPFNYYWSEIVRTISTYSLSLTEEGNKKLDYFKKQTPSILNLVSYVSWKNKNLLQTLINLESNNFFQKGFNNTPGILRNQTISLTNNFKCSDSYILLRNLLKSKNASESINAVFTISCKYIDTFYKGQEQRLLDHLLVDFLHRGELENFKVVLRLCKKYKPDTLIENEHLDTYHVGTKLFTHRINFINNEHKFPIMLYALLYGSEKNYNYLKQEPYFFNEGIDWLKKQPEYLLNIAKLQRIQDVEKILGIKLGDLKDSQKNNYLHYYFKDFIYEKPNFRVIKYLVKENKNILEEKNNSGKSWQDALENFANSSERKVEKNKLLAKLEKELLKYEIKEKKVNLNDSKTLLENMVLPKIMPMSEHSALKNKKKQKINLL